MNLADALAAHYKKRDAPTEPTEFERGVVAYLGDYRKTPPTTDDDTDPKDAA